MENINKNHTYKTVFNKVKSVFIYESYLKSTHLCQ